jgi:hypothetical protein
VRERMDVGGYGRVERKLHGELEMINHILLFQEIHRA